MIAMEYPIPQRMHLIFFANLRILGALSPPLCSCCSIRKSHLTFGSLFVPYFLLFSAWAWSVPMDLITWFFIPQNSTMPHGFFLLR